MFLKPNQVLVHAKMLNKSSHIVCVLSTMSSSHMASMQMPLIFCGPDCPQQVVQQSNYLHISSYD
jgi:hypothetical protein